MSQNKILTVIGPNNPEIQEMVDAKFEEICKETPQFSRATVPQIATSQAWYRLSFQRDENEQYFCTVERLQWRAESFGQYPCDGDLAKSDSASTDGDLANSDAASTDGDHASNDAPSTDGDRANSDAPSTDGDPAKSDAASTDGDRANSDALAKSKAVNPGRKSAPKKAAKKAAKQKAPKKASKKKAAAKK